MIARRAIGSHAILTGSTDAGGRTVHVTASQLTWSPGGTLALPDPWTNLEIRQFRRKTYVFVDGKEFGIIPREK